MTSSGVGVNLGWQAGNARMLSESPGKLGALRMSPGKRRSQNEPHVVAKGASHSQAKFYFYPPSPSIHATCQESRLPAPPLRASSCSILPVEGCCSADTSNKYIPFRQDTGGRRPPNPLLSTNDENFRQHPGG